MRRILALVGVGGLLLSMSACKASADPDNINEFAAENSTQDSFGDITKALPAYPGAEPMRYAEGYIRHTRSDADATMFSTDDSVDEIKTFYDRAAARLGWKRGKPQRRKGLDVISYKIGETWVHLIIEDSSDSRQVLIVSRKSNT